MHKIQKKIPVPKTFRPRSSIHRKYPFEEMQIGDMFFVPEKTRNTLAPHASTMGKELSRKFVTRLLFMSKKNGDWEACDPNDKGAVLGVGVWRIK